jgi:excisionase family DNA binding protein
MPSIETAPKPEALWGVKEAAVYLGVNERTVLRLMQQGSVPGFRLGKLWRVSPAALRAYVQLRHVNPLLSTSRSF